MYSSYSNKIQETNAIVWKYEEIRFLAILCVIAGILFISLYESTALPLVALTVPLVLYDRAFMFPMFLTITLSQGAFVTATEVTGTQDASYAESLAIAAVTPMLLYDLLTQKSKMVPYRFVIFYVIFVCFVAIGCFNYYQHPENYQGLAPSTGRYSAILRSITKSIKIIFYLFYVRVLINYPLSTNLRTLEFTRRCTPFIIITLGVFLLLFGRVQNGAGYSGALQLGDAHHGTFTSELCALGIYLFITLFSPKIKFFTRFFSIGAIVMLGVIIMMMGSRNGLLSFGVLCCIGLFINIKNKKIDFQFIVVIAAILAGVIGIIISLNSPTIQRAIYMTEVASGGDRTYYWAAGTHAIAKYPIFGLGGDESASIGAVARYAPAVIEDKVMHNTYLEMAVEYGLFALIFYLLLVFFTLTWGYRLYKLALRKNWLLLAGPPISYLIIMFAAMFISEIWATAIWYNISLIFALSIQLLYTEYISKRPVNTFSSFQHQLAQMQD